MAALSLDAIAAAVSTMKEAAQDFAQAGADVVAQFGVPFSLLHGAGARGVQASVSRAAGVPVALMGVAMLDALSELGARSVAVAGGYYAARGTGRRWRGQRLPPTDSTWSTRRIWIQQGVVGSVEEQDRLAWDHGPGPTCAHVRETARRAPDATDAIAVLGGGLRLQGLAEDLERETGLPIVGEDLALFWATLRAMKARPRRPRLGLPARQCLMAPTGATPGVRRALRQKKG